MTLRFGGIKAYKYHKKFHTIDITPFASTKNTTGWTMINCAISIFPYF